MLYSRSLLFIYFIYSSMYLLVSNSQFIPSPTFPFGNHKLAFYVCESSRNLHFWNGTQIDIFCKSSSDHTLEMLARKRTLQREKQWDYKKNWVQKSQERREKETEQVGI